MTIPYRPAVLLLLLLSACQGPSARTTEVASPQPSLSPALSQAFAWFDSLGFPDLSQRRYLETPQGHGFVLEDQGETCTLFTRALEAQTVSKAPRTVTWWIGDGIEEVVESHLITREADARSACEALLRESREKLQSQDPDDPFGLRRVTRVELFLLGRVCYEQGHFETGRAAAQFALQSPPYRIDRRGHLPSFEVLSQDFAYVAIWAAVLEFENTGTGRQELLTRFRQFVTAYPESEHVELAQETVAILTQMVNEEKQRNAPAASEPSTRERIADLILRLRDQPGSQRGAPGRCTVFEPSIGESSTPVDLLVRHGYDAVPQLVDALDDSRFSRAVAHHRPYYFSHYVLRVGDCALQVLEEIADRSFFEPSSTFSYMTKDGEVAETKAKVLAWWELVQADQR